MVLCLAGGSIGYVIGHINLPYHQGKMKIVASEPVETQLFYDTGRGFNEEESVKQVVYQAGVPVILDFSFPGRTICAIRFDPGKKPVQMEIHDIMLQYRGEPPFRVPLDSLVPSNDILSLEYDGLVLTIKTTAAANDPIVLLKRIGPAPHSSLLRNLIHILAGAGIALGVAFFSVWVYRMASSSGCRQG
jgi:hypothetical protein